MNGLPAGLAEPLHLVAPIPLRALLFFATAVALLGWALWRHHRRRQQPSAAVAPARATSQGEPGIFARIIELRRRYGESNAHRQGCHALAALLRDHFEATSSHPCTILTGLEIDRAFEDRSWSGLFELLGELQFRRREPSEKEFHTAYYLAAEAVATPGERKRHNLQQARQP